MQLNALCILLASSLPITACTSSTIKMNPKVQTAEKVRDNCLESMHEWKVTSSLIRQIPDLDSITLNHLTDSSKVTEEQKPSIMKLASYVEVCSKAQIALNETMKNLAPSSDLTRRMASAQIAALMMLYKENITFGQYNQLRKDLEASRLKEWNVIEEQKVDSNR